MIISTPHGDFATKRKDVVAISVVRAKRRVRHHRIWLREGETTHIEHRRIPKSIVGVKANISGWAEYVETFNLDGEKLNLKCCHEN